MDERLTQEQRELVEKNLTVIDCVIRSCVHANNNICGMEYDDLYQIGAIGLCKAASRYKQCKQAAFSTYVFHVVKNTIIDYLRGLNTRLRVQSCFLEESERYNAISPFSACALTTNCLTSSLCKTASKRS